MDYCEECGRTKEQSRIYKYKGVHLCNKHYQQMKNMKIITRTKYDRNEIYIKNYYAEIYLYDSHGNYKGKTIIDRDDVPKVLNYKWHLSRQGYVGTDIKGKRVLLHRIILGVDKEVVDHINRNPMDNRKINLRKCTQEQNTYNSSIRSDNRSGITGVNYSNKKGKWRAYITVNKKTIHLGWFTTKEEAMEKRKQAETQYFGEFVPVFRKEGSYV